MRVRTVALLASGLLAAALLAAAPARGQSTGPATVAWTSLRLADGSTLEAGRLNASPVIVVFWATWCGFCERHNARVERLHRSLVVGVSIDGDAAAVGRMARERGWTFPVTVDTGSIRRQFTPRRLVPMTCIVAPGGQLKQCIPGEMSDDDVMALGKAARS
jgi:thiol-disulfide isomerase/thioredoxin